MTFRSPIGFSDFGKLRRAKAYYVDKTQLLVDLIANTTEVALFPRPRRFGKTLMQSVLRYFFEVSDEDLSWMFEDLKVWQCEECRKHFQKHPVIDLSFKGVKSPDWDSMQQGLAEVFAREYQRHDYLLESDVLRSYEKEKFELIASQKADIVSLIWSMAHLSWWLWEYHGEECVILLDEYDVPIQAAYIHGFYDQAVDGFFRDFVTQTFKDNKKLYRGVLTGILRISKESMFSGANNINVYSILTRPYSTSFGFTQEEVDGITEQLPVPDAAETVKEWYNGYRFAGTVIYNPWSVLKYAEQPEMPMPHWVFSGADDVLRKLVLGRGRGLAKDLERLVRGEALERVVTDYMILPDIERSPGAVWNLLFLSGYLTMRKWEGIEGRYHAELVIPNKEVRILYEDNLTQWLEQVAPDGADGLRDLYEAMFEGNEEDFQELLAELVVNTFSYHDLPDDAPESVFQAFILGAMLNLRSEYQVKTNRESGRGRYDLALIPKQPGKPGVVFEFKRLRKRRNETPEQGLEVAKEQLSKLGYDAELKEAGADPVIQWAVVHQGKDVWVERVQ